MTSNLNVLHFAFKPAGAVPNNPLLPLVVYKGVFLDVGQSERADLIEKQIQRHGWVPAWRYGVYDFAHYHSTAHELLGVYRGKASLRLGHESGITLVVEAGDVLALPAGTGHQNLGSSEDFHVVGAYPDGQKADLIKATESDPEASRKRIAQVPLPRADPVTGTGGPLVELWHLLA